MNQTMLAESLIKDKNFIKKQLRSIHPKFWNILSLDEIKSELYLAIFNCSKKFNPKLGNIFPYIKSSFINNLNKMANDRSFFFEMEAPLEAAANMPCEEKEEDYSIELLKYLGGLPPDLLLDLTDFVLGQKNKEEIVSNPSFQRINVDRVLDKLDSIILRHKV